MDRFYIDFETAKKLKQKGYDIQLYGNKDKTPYHIFEVQRWFREEKKIDIAPYASASGYSYAIEKAYFTGDISGGTHVRDSEDTGPNLAGRWETYEEALKAGIEDTLKKLL